MCAACATHDVSLLGDQNSHDVMHMCADFVYCNAWRGQQAITLHAMQGCQSGTAAGQDSSIAVDLHVCKHMMLCSCTVRQEVVCWCS